MGEGNRQRERDGAQRAEARASGKVGVVGRRCTREEAKRQKEEGRKMPR